MQWIGNLSRWFAVFGSALMLLTGLMTVTSVVLRALTTSPIKGDVELTQFGIAIGLSLCIPWCQLRGGNIIVDFFTQHMTATRQRALDGFGTLLIACMYGLLAWRTAIGAGSVMEAHETSMILGIPSHLMYYALAPGLALAALVALVQTYLHFTNRAINDLMGDMQ